MRELGRARPRLAAAVLADTISFRESWYAVSTAPWEARDFPSGDLDIVAAAVAGAAAVSRLAPGGEGRVLIDGGDATSAGCGFPCTGLPSPPTTHSRAATSRTSARCAGYGCGWLFFDPSHRRHWCIMAICGNRAKARAYAERRRASVEAG